MTQLDKETLLSYMRWRSKSTNMSITIREVQKDFSEFSADIIKKHLNDLMDENKVQRIKIRGIYHYMVIQ